MKVIAFNGSARKDGNTAAMVRWVFEELEKRGIETELFQMKGKKIQGCIACYKCMERKDGRCAVKNDIANDCIAKMVEADGIILASPTYFANVTTEMKALIDRAGLVGKANGDHYKLKPGASITPARRGGAIHTPRTGHYRQHTLIRSARQDLGETVRILGKTVACRRENRPHREMPDVHATTKAPSPRTPTSLRGSSR